MAFPPEKKYYHMRIKYISGGKTSYFYEVNKPKILFEVIILQIEALVPVIRFEGHRLYPKRINEYKIFVTESPSEMSPEPIRDVHPEGYDFGGDDNTLEITTQARERSMTKTVGLYVDGISEMVKNIEPEPKTPEGQSMSEIVSEKLEIIEDIVERIDEQTSPPTLWQRIQENALDYIITFVIGGFAVGLWLIFVG